MPYFQQHAERYDAWLGEIEPMEAELMKATTNYVARQFTKEVVAERKLDYLVSAYIADLLLNHNGLEAIVYPSVPLGLRDVNIAIRTDVFDRLFRPVKASEQIVRSETYSSQTAQAVEFDTNKDTIVWDAESVSEEELANLHLQI